MALALNNLEGWYAFKTKKPIPVLADQQKLIRCDLEY